MQRRPPHAANDRSRRAVAHRVARSLLALIALAPAAASGAGSAMPLQAPLQAAAEVGARLPTAAAAAKDEYRIAAGDELEISVWGEERMQRTVRVLPDGTFSFPLAGTIAATGQTVQQLSSLIRGRIASYYRADIPDVTVGVRTAATLTFYVVGKVRTPGTYAGVRGVNILQALSMAGGLAEFADVKHAVILRQTATGQSVEPVQLATILKGRRRLASGALDSALPVLGSGDVLVIP